MICFCSGLNPEVKKLLVTMDLAQGYLKDLDNLEDHSCRAEKALETEGFSTQKCIKTTIAPSACPRLLLLGVTAQGNHGQEQCHYCKRLGHHASVCLDKFLGHMPGLGLKPVRIYKINSAVSFTLFSGETVNIGASPPAPTATITSTVPSAPVSASYTPSSDVVACIAAFQDSLNQQNAMIQQLMGQKDF
ncbi:hypothetical protein PQX77_017494 [Marasmius sp. AFHP31]|nr:hypothetical protein PQX77_017494 [Marasmius sp. AFHP31]